MGYLRLLYLVRLLLSPGHAGWYSSAVLAAYSTFQLLVYLLLLVETFFFRLLLLLLLYLRLMFQLQAVLKRWRRVVRIHLIFSLCQRVWMR